jgi:hypothetical protein
MDCLPGVRRVTLNHNVNIGDVGAVRLMDVLRDDVFLKGEKRMKHCADTCHSRTSSSLLPPPVAPLSKRVKCLPSCCLPGSYTWRC